jgi:hypothetical protein
VNFTLSWDHVSHVEALAAVIRQPHEQRREVGVGRISLEPTVYRPKSSKCPSYPSSAIASDALDFDALGMFPFAGEG